MKISRELIEKYHDGRCTPAEKAAVEDWLLSDEIEEEKLKLQAGEDKMTIRQEMWNDIESVLPGKKKKIKVVYFNTIWKRVAAILVVGLTGAGVFYFNPFSGNSKVIVINNASETVNKDLTSSAYTISIGPKSNVEINNEKGSIDFCGAMLINPKHDIEFTIQGTCANDVELSEKMVLKKGLNYIALNYSTSTKANEVIILEEGSMMELPPLMKRQLMSQFDI